MKRFFTSIVIALFASQLYAITEGNEYWNRVNSYDYDSFLAEYNNTNENNEAKKGKLAYALYLTGDKSKEWIEIATSNILNAVEKNSISDSELADMNYILAESSINLIVDASTYMEYSSVYEKAIIKCLTIDPENPYYKLNSAKGMMRMPTSMGSEEDGEALLFTLEKEYPSNPNVLMAVSNFRLDNGEVLEAEEGYKKVLSLNSRHKEAQDKLSEIDLSKKELEIRDITIVNEIKTSKKRVLRKVSDFKGQNFGINTKSEINSEVSEISSIGSTEVKGVQIDEKYIDLELTVDEDNTRALMFILSSGFGFDYDNDVVPGGAAAVGYMDANFLGTGNSIMFLTAGIFNKFDLTCPGLIDDGVIDMKITLESLIYQPTKGDIYRNGEIYYSQKDTFHAAQIGFGRETEIGASAFVHYRSDWTIMEDIKDHSSPNMIHTNTVMAEIGIDTAGMALSALENVNGIKVYFNPAWIYKDNYEPWGKNGMLFEHDGKPAYKFETQLGYYTDTVKNQNLMVDVKWLSTINPYESTKFFIGHPQSVMDSYSLSGYLPGEIAIEDGLTGNLKYTFNIIPQKFNLYGKYDVLYDLNEEEFHNGTAIGAVAKLPFDIEFASEIGVGFNAERKDGAAFNITFSFTKLSIL